MFPFKTSASEYETTDRGQYKVLDDPTEDDLGGTPLKELGHLRKSLRFYKVGFYTVLAFQALAVVYWAFLGHANSHPSATYRDLEWSGLLGEDWNGLVPNGVGQPLKPVYFGPDHPYYMPEDIFDNFDKSMAMIDNVLVDKDAPRVKRIKPDGDVAEMEPFWPWEPRADGKQIYAIRGFHQMHCIVCEPFAIVDKKFERNMGTFADQPRPAQFVISEEFTFHYNRVNETKWTAGHVAHCINTVRDAIMCMADSQPLSFANGYKVGHATDDQAMMCRDWKALHAWVSDPSRGVRVKNAAPPGSKSDMIVPIIPYPELTEAELKGDA
ncbi:Thioesterase [Colletotrichum higginsianum IMI 349063]|uniref:Thioesterase n=2 Tax=Colletotrichum higginsianum (strain IMI 349063) TaxID=759273 RepID=A0A1B7XTQ3_COLHI|nr:Thioesterase [Colletotrichum higginsianum IMI 349063]OBR03141.1 Thioesterase [Colletotrichum higginsianum IMI 349063]